MANLTGNAGNNNITGTNLHDVIFGLAGNDTLRGLDDNDRIDGGGGNDFIYGDYGNDTIYGRLGTDRLSGREAVISPGRVGAEKQITQCPSPAQRQSDPPPVLWPVVQQMAPLAECLDIAVPAPAVRGIMVEVGGRQHDLGRTHWHILGQSRRGDPATPSVPPDLPLLVPPAAIAQVPHDLAMGRPQT